MHRKSSQITSRNLNNTITMNKISKFNMQCAQEARDASDGCEVNCSPDVRIAIWSNLSSNEPHLQSRIQWLALAGGMIAIYYVGTQGSDSGNNGVTGNAGGEVSSASPRVCSLRLSCQTLLFLIQGRNTLARVYNTAYSSKNLVCPFRLNFILFSSVL